jgi:ABC-type lipoprotein export system ATPase subunit
MDLFHEYNKQGTTLLIATHDHSIYDYPGSKVVTIEHGRLLVTSDSDESRAKKIPPKKPDSTKQEEEELYQQMIIKEGLEAVTNSGLKI